MTPPLQPSCRNLPPPTRDPARTAGTVHPGTGRRYLNSPPSPALKLARACSGTLRAAERTETTSLLLLAGVVAAGLFLSASVLESCLTGWPRFEQFVRAVLS